MVGLLGFLSLTVPGPSFARLRPLTQDHMRTVTGREGIVSDISLRVLIDTVEFLDHDGNAGNSGALFRMGGSETPIKIDDGSDAAAALGGLTFDVDAGLESMVVGLPDGEFSVSIPRMSVAGLNSSPGDEPSLGAYTLSSISGEGTQLQFSALDEGLGVDGELKLTMDRLRWRDADGVSDPDFSGSSGTVDLCDGSQACLTLGNGSEGSVSFHGIEFHADQSEGLVIHSAAIPTYELRADILKLDGSSAPIEPIIVRDLDPSGSWMKVKGH